LFMSHGMKQAGLILLAFSIFSVLPGKALVGAQVGTQTNAPATTKVDAPDVKELQAVEDKWSNALNQRDQYALELVLSPLFVNVGANGDITTRDQQVVAVINPEDKTASTEFRVITVRMLGDVAVANGTYAYTHKMGNGEGVEKGVFTHVFQRQRSSWVCLNAQRTALREDPIGKAKPTKAKGKSEAELPFHIPLFSKGDKDKSDSN
jgi:hypothetical protein